MEKEIPKKNRKWMDVMERGARAGMEIRDNCYFGNEEYAAKISIQTWFSTTDREIEYKYDDASCD